MDIQIVRARSVDDPLHHAIHSLLSQLSPGASPPTKSELAALLRGDTTALFVARVDRPDGPIVGMIAVVSYQVPSGRLSRIEDLVVDTSARGQGIGEALTKTAVRHARSFGSKAVDLTSNPARRSANRLYQRLGFTRGQTNVYRLWLNESTGGS